MCNADVPVMAGRRLGFRNSAQYPQQQSRETTGTMSDDKQQQSWRPRFDYDVDYNDHFETPLTAYKDISPLLDSLNDDDDNSKKKQRCDHVLYDPYYCNGRTAQYLTELGFEKVIHCKRDFYKDIADGSIPIHDTFITNPPYSDSHKERCLDFCVRQFREQGRPFFLLMPDYVASKGYFRRILGDHIDDVAFLLPSIPYQYDHPEGTGHPTSPFQSLWFCGVGRDRIKLLRTGWERRKSGQRSNGPKFVTSLGGLEALGVIEKERRPNPRQRKKRRLRGNCFDSASGSITQKRTQLTSTTNVKKVVTKLSSDKKKPSRYRDPQGNRTKKRF